MRPWAAGLTQTIVSSTDVGVARAAQDLLGLATTVAVGDRGHGARRNPISNEDTTASGSLTKSSILGISGSLRSGSLNTRLLHAAAKLLAPGVELELFDGLREIPPYDFDRDVEPAEPPVARLREAIARADGVLIATPEFNGSIPGVLKNALDWASRPFPDNSLRGKPVAVIGASSGLFGAVWAQDTTRKVLEVVGADVISGEFPLGQADSSLVADEVSLDAEQRASLSELLGVLAARAGAERAGAEVS